MIFIDSNIWCYYFDQRLPEHKKVVDTVREIVLTRDIACNTVIVMEVAHYLVRHFNEQVARKKIDFFINLRNLEIIDFDRQAMRESLEILLENAHAQGLGGRDATIVGVMGSRGITEIVSHDDVFKRLSSKAGLEVTDPVPTP